MDAYMATLFGKKLDQTTNTSPWVFCIINQYLILTNVYYILIVYWDFNSSWDIASMLGLGNMNNLGLGTTCDMALINKLQAHTPIHYMSFSFWWEFFTTYLAIWISNKIFQIERINHIRPTYLTHGPQCSLTCFYKHCFALIMSTISEWMRLHNIA
jgi:hypothetical protein